MSLTALLFWVTLVKSVLCFWTSTPTAWVDLEWHMPDPTPLEVSQPHVFWFRKLCRQQPSSQKGKYESWRHSNWSCFLLGCPCSLSGLSEINCCERQICSTNRKGVLHQSTFVWVHRECIFFTGQAAEVFPLVLSPMQHPSVSLPQARGDRWTHTAGGWLLCGGAGSPASPWSVWAAK